MQRPSSCLPSEGFGAFRVSEFGAYGFGMFEEAFFACVALLLQLYAAEASKLHAPR